MDRNKNSKGREKNVTSGSGNVYKRGEGLGGKKPVGNSGAYKERKEKTVSYNSNQSSSSQSNLGNIISGLGSSQNTSASSGSYQKASGGFNIKRIITIAIVVIIAYFVLKSCMNIDLLGGMDTENIVYNNQSSSDSSQSSYNGLASSESVDYTVSDDARAKYTSIIGNSQDEYTIMVYMCGSDLESRSGMATADLQEMLYAEIADNVNVIVETGGASQWKNSTISNRTNQRYQITGDGLVQLDENVGKKSMTEPATLSDFIKYCKTNFKADRYALILWDHGGGSNQGYGHDELFPNSTMTLDEIDTALTSANVKFDWVGFDACLMATYETAIMLNDHADYLIASEETEPGIGWYYTDWLTALSNNTSMLTVDIGKNIIDSFTEKSIQASANEKTTLSIIDLAELSGTVPKVFNAFASSTGELIDSDEYKIVADARGNSREFGYPSQLDQIDLIHLAQNIDTDEAKELIEALDDAIKYNRTSSTISNANGISIYFPYTTLSSMGSMIDTYEKIGMDKAYTDCIRGFASLEAGGQIISSGSSNPLGSLFGSASQGGSGQIIGSLLQSFITGGGLESMLGGSDTSWVDTDSMLNNTDYYEQNNVEDDAMQIVEKDGGYVLKMSDENWDLIQKIELNVFYDDGEGYIDLGMDNVYTFDDDGDLMIDYDGTWLALNGQIVAYYFMEEKREGDDYAILGRVPAMLNDELVDLILAFTNEKPFGEVLGARLIYDDGTTAKGLQRLEYGDVLDFICDYYTYDEEFYDSYYLGDRMVVEDDFEISNVSVGDARCLVTYRLTDMYKNTYWTPAIEYE